MSAEPRVVAATLVQLRARTAALGRGARHVGWKVALGFAEIEAVVGDQPVVGHLTSETVVPSGSAVSVGGLRSLRVETELVVELGAGVGRDAGPRDVANAVRALGVGLEIVDVARPPDDLEGIIAANVAHRACVLGPTKSIALPPDGVARTLIDGRRREVARLDTSYLARLAGIARVLASVGLALQAGDRVLTGSATHVEAGPGDHVTAEITALGSVDVRLVD